MTTTQGVQASPGRHQQLPAEHPGFFERHAELLATVQLTSPHGQRAVSLQERQMKCCASASRGWSTRSSR